MKHNHTQYPQSPTDVVARLTITVYKNNDIKMDGPLNNPELCIRLLHKAMEGILYQRAAPQAQPSVLVPPHAREEAMKAAHRAAELLKEGASATDAEVHEKAKQANDAPFVPQPPVVPSFPVAPQPFWKRLLRKS